MLIEGRMKRADNVTNCFSHDISLHGASFIRKPGAHHKSMGFWQCAKKNNKRLTHMKSCFPFNLSFAFPPFFLTSCSRTSSYHHHHHHHHHLWRTTTFFLSSTRKAQRKEKNCVFLNCEEGSRLSLITYFLHLLSKSPYGCSQLSHQNSQSCLKKLKYCKWVFLSSIK